LRIDLGLYPHQHLCPFRLDLVPGHRLTFPTVVTKRWVRRKGSQGRAIIPVRPSQISLIAPIVCQLLLIRPGQGTRPDWRTFCGITVLILEPDMSQTPHLHPRDACPDQTYDECLRKAFALVLNEDLPLRLRVVLDALRQKGTADDAQDNRS